MEDRDSERDIDSPGIPPGGGPRLIKIGGSLTRMESAFQSFQMMSESGGRDSSDPSLFYPDYLW